ncbi:2-hydroxycarboxylate transporter family protein [Enterococcus faecalis]|uniref:2-hydroxycarboxylate transporter family protein n=1 Tax=Enterococcus faecalis TaxID=1351 RepID=UPI0001F0D167|nr:2-hydroxycarboxylate transporter family protein [Enterococcus faecalis]EFT95497.1 bacterial sodium:citrate symporter [Enterococcus faecalis TX0012]
MLTKLNKIKIGYIPLILYIILALTYIAITVANIVPKNDMLVALGIMTVFAYLLEKIGKNIPILKNLGGKVLVVTFLPAFLVYKHWLPESTVKVVSDFMNHNNFLMFFITLLVVGSIASMNRQTLVKATSRIIFILILCNVLSSLIGVSVGMLLGLSAWNTYFFIVAPIMAGGVGEGAMPLSIGYAATMAGVGQNAIFGKILPCVMLGSLVAVLLSGVLSKVGEKYPHLNGHGNLIDSEDEHLENLKGKEKPIDIEKTLVAGVVAITVYFIAVYVEHLLKIAFGFVIPSPVILLVSLMGAKMLGFIPKDIEEGGNSLYGFTVRGITPPLLFGVGVAQTDWLQLIEVFKSPATILTIIITVVAIVVIAFITATILKMYPVDTAIAISCCSGQGGTGALAILAAGNRMELMPFAQVAVRLGGAMTVTFAIFLMGLLS